MMFSQIQLLAQCNQAQWHPLRESNHQIDGKHSYGAKKHGLFIIVINVYIHFFKYDIPENLIHILP